MATALPLSLWAIECIDKLRRAFIWAGAESVAAGKCKVAWETVCRPRELGGLGVVDLRRAGVALRVRWKWLRRVDDQRTWSSLPDEHERSVVAVFQAATTSSLGDGATTLFWTDNWIGGSSIRVLAPTVIAAVPKRRRSTTVADALNNRAWARQITGPRTMRLIIEFMSLWALVEQVQLTPGVPDTFTWSLSSDGMACTRLHLCVGQCSQAPRHRWEPSSSGKLQRRRGFDFSSGSLCMTGVGQLTGGAAMGFRTTTSVSSVTRQWSWRRWTISYLAVCSAETSDVWAGCLRWLRLDAMVHV